MDDSRLFLLTGIIEDFIALENERARRSGLECDGDAARVKAITDRLDSLRELLLANLGEQSVQMRQAKAIRDFDAYHPARGNA